MATAAIERYLQRKSELRAQFLEGISRRELCVRCRKPSVTCYCPHLAPLMSDPRMLILMHPLESKHPVGTGRMAHRCLANSELWIGSDFAESRRMQSLLEDPKLFPMILFPGPRSRNLSEMAVPERRALIPEGREAVIIVLDATWHLAKKMLHRSPNLQKLPRIGFTPPRPSQFLVRKQPSAHCFSTIEAIHEVISLFSPSERKRDVLLEVFDKMVAQQLSFRALQAGRARHTQSYWDRKARRQRRLEEGLL